jgi:hypothetical protein
MKKARLIFSAAALFLIASLPSCTTGQSAGAEAGKVDHCVFVWLKKSGDKADRARLVEAARRFEREIPEIERLTVGQMLPSARPIVDSTYDVAFIMRFADKAAMDRYEKHPVHQAAVKDLLLPISKKVQVYDLVVE